MPTIIKVSTVSEFIAELIGHRPLVTSNVVDLRLEWQGDLQFLNATAHLLGQTLELRENLGDPVDDHLKASRLMERILATCSELKLRHNYMLLPKPDINPELN